MTDHSPAADLRRIADLLDQGLPAPISITPSVEGYPTAILVSDEDFAAWLTALDAPMPEWRLSDRGWEHAGTPAGGFEITSCRKAVA